MSDRTQLGATQRWVVKIGSSLVTRDGTGIDRDAIADWAEQLVTLRETGREIVLVSSGAVAEGLRRLGRKKRPRALHELQATAAVGQTGLVEAYESVFARHGLHSAQVLLTHDDLVDRKRYLNARSTLCTLLALKTIPIVNENDTVATEEIRFGDNDTLAALVTNLVEAPLLVILTDQAGLYRNDPRAQPDVELVPEGRAGDPELDRMAGAGAGSLGRGGMRTKLRAATRAARSGAHTWIASGREPDVLGRIARGETLGTVLQPALKPVTARKQWLASQLQVRGRIVLDDGAVKVLCGSGKSLLPIGVTRVDGEFVRGELVVCLDSSGREIGRGLINYSAEESRRIVGQPSHKIEEILGYIDEPELIHRDNFVCT